MRATCSGPGTLYLGVELSSLEAMGLPRASRQWHGEAAGASLEITPETA